MIVPSVKSTTGVYESWGMIEAFNNSQQDDALPEKIPHTTEGIKAIGEIIQGYKPRANMFVDYLFGKIGMTKLSYMRFNNPWKWAKRGKLEMGETIEEIWEGECESFGFNPAKSEERFLKMAKSSGAVAFHSVNYHAVYKVTVAWDILKRAFLSYTGLRDYVDVKVSQPKRQSEVDEFMMIKYLIASALLQGKIKTVTIDPITKNNADDVAAAVAETTNLFQFPSTDYTMAGNENTTSIDDLMILESAAANALIKVYSLANAFNVDYVKFIGNVTMFDDLSKFNWKRMEKLMSEDPGFRPFTAEELERLKTVQVIAMDKRWMQIYDVMEEMGEPLRNGEGLYENMFYHVAQVISASPFYNCVAYTTLTNGIVSLTINPGAVSLPLNGTYGFTCDVQTQGFADPSVVWSVSGNSSEGTWINPDTGVLRIGANETAERVTVKATSVAFNATTAGKSPIASATVTIVR